MQTDIEILTASGNFSIRLLLTLRYRREVHSENLEGNEVNLLCERAKLYQGQAKLASYNVELQCVRERVTYRSSSFFIISTTSSGKD